MKRDSYSRRKGNTPVNELFTLSVLRPYANMILAGTKRWEFRLNPEFGRAGDHEFATEDTVFIVAMGPETTVTCFCRVGCILRGEELRVYFDDPATGHWREAGCREGMDRDWVFFEREIVNQYETAIELAVRPLRSLIPVDTVRHRQTGKPWSGRGFCHVSQLHRYDIEDQELAAFLAELVASESR